MRLLEALVVRSEDYRLAPYGSFEQIMYAHSESASDIRHISIAIYRREQAVAVNDESRGVCSLLCAGGIATLQFRISY